MAGTALRLLRCRYGRHGCRRAVLCHPARPLRCLEGAPAPPVRRSALAAVRPGRAAGRPPPVEGAAPPPSLAVATALARVRAKQGRRWERGSHLHVGPGCQPPFVLFLFSNFNYLF